MPSPKTASRASRKGAPCEPPRKGAPDQSLRVDVVPARMRGLATWLASVAPARARGAMTVAIVADARVRLLNRQYRRKDKPTDVLSFPSDERGYLGDVVIAA